MIRDLEMDSLMSAADREAMHMDVAFRLVV